MDDIDAWLVDSNDALSINLTRDVGDPIFPQPFHPAFTYTIFGEEEKIFGYQDLDIALRLRAHDLRLSLNITYDKKWKPVGEIAASDIEGQLKEVLPECAFRDLPYSKENAQPAQIQADENWKPPGDFLNTYERNGERFEVWCSNLSNERCKEIFKAAQILVPLFIEGGTCQSLDDQLWTIERWKVFFLYRVSSTKESCPYNIVGFSTSYRLWVFPSEERLQDELESSEGMTEITDLDGDTKKENLKNPLDNYSRERISQFLILPPYQGQSHGRRLYDSMMDNFLHDPNLFEISVEDPSEAFDDLRDLCDLQRLRIIPAFSDLTIADTISQEHLKSDAPIPAEMIVSSQVANNLRRQTKIFPRQFARLLEMHLLDKIPPLHRNTARITRKAASADSNDRRYYFWRLLVKERLYKHNYDALAQMDHSERIEKLEETIASVQEGYERLLIRVQRSPAQTNNKDSDDGKVRSSSRVERVAHRRKRTVIEDDDCESDASATKKQRHQS